MQAPVKHIIQNQTLWLSPERSIFWEDEKALIVSDLHLGKTGHFRKAGIAVPQHVYKEDLQRLFQQIQHFKPNQLIVVGDLFHSTANKELDLFGKWRKDHVSLPMHLVKGNHDILSKAWYDEMNIITAEKELLIKDFSFIHDPQTAASCRSLDHYCFSGHLHPGVLIKGLGKQSLRFPCFYFGEHLAIMPAFSRFTGITSIEKKPNDRVFMIVENKIVDF